MKLNLKQIQKRQDELHRKAPIVDVVERLGGLNLIATGNSLQGPCPTGHDSEHNRCFSANVDQNFYHCFSCGIGGDVISLVSMVKDIDYSEAVEWLKTEFNIELDDKIQVTKSDKEKQEARELREKASLYEIIYQYGKQKLFEPEGKDALLYLIQERGYHVDNIKNSEWIYFPPTNEIKQHLLDDLPDANDAIEKLKLNGSYGDKFRLAFPYRNKDGLITGFMKRALAPHGIRAARHNGMMDDNVRWDSTKGLSKKDLFNLCKCHGEDTLTIVEGYPDALMLPTMGIRNVVAVGQGLLSQSHLDGLTMFGIENVIISFDNDDIGPGNTMKAIDLLFKDTDINVFVLDPSMLDGSKDPDEYVKANGIDAFKQLVDKAESAEKWKTKQLISGYDLNVDQQRQNALDDALDFHLTIMDPLKSYECLNATSVALSIPMTILEEKAVSYREKKEQQEVGEKCKDLTDKVGELASVGKLEKAFELMDDNWLGLKNQFLKIKAKPSMPFELELEEIFREDDLRDPNKLLGYPLTKFKEMAKLLDGIQPGFYMLGAETNVGKTAVLTNLCLDLIETNPYVQVLYPDFDSWTCINY